PPGHRDRGPRRRHHRVPPGGIRPAVATAAAGAVPAGDRGRGGRRPGPRAERGLGRASRRPARAGRPVRGAARRARLRTGARGPGRASQGRWRPEVLHAGGADPMTSRSRSDLRTSAHLELDRRYAAQNYAPLPVVIAEAEGAWVTDVEGRRYLDCLAGYSALQDRKSVVQGRRGA